jgi:hypothetical protein
VKRFLKTLISNDDRLRPRYLLSFQDLNGDGNSEAIAYLISNGLCGSGGCAMFILEPKGDSWTIVTRMTITRPPIYVLSDMSHGWHSIGVWVQGGGIQPGYEAELSFDGKTYPSNPSVPPAKRLEGTPAGQEVMTSMRDAKYLYDDAAPPSATTASAPASPGSLLGFLRSQEDLSLKEGGILDKRNPPRYVSAYRDLDGDGKPEAIVYMVGRDWCGSGGCSVFILKQQDDAWKKVTEITLSYPPVYVLPGVSHGWHDIAVWVRDMDMDDGGGHETELSFDGKTYPRNPSTHFTRQLKGKPAGQLLITSAMAATPLYGDAVQ